MKKLRFDTFSDLDQFVDDLVIEIKNQLSHADGNSRIYASMIRLLIGVKYPEDKCKYDIFES